MCTSRRRGGKGEERRPHLLFFVVVEPLLLEAISSLYRLQRQCKTRREKGLISLSLCSKPLVSSTILLLLYKGIVCVIHEHAIGRRSLLHPFFFMGSSLLSFFFLFFSYLSSPHIYRSPFSRHSVMFCFLLRRDALFPSSIKKRKTRKDKRLRTLLLFGRLFSLFACRNGTATTTTTSTTTTTIRIQYM